MPGDKQLRTGTIFSSHIKPYCMRFLSIPAAMYRAMMALRATMYARSFFSAWRPPRPCISVGNIRWGGTGKTPICAWLLAWAAERNRQCVLLTRGYRAHPPRLPFHVKPDASPQKAGDEPLLLARTFPASKIVVDPKRSRAGKWAWASWQPDLFLLDDGLQHMAVARDINLVLLTLPDLENDWNKVVPSGPWREGPSALSRADAYLIKLPDPVMATPSLQKKIAIRLGEYAKPTFFFGPQPVGLTNLHTGEHRSNLPEQAAGRYTLFSGVADPLSVEHTATNFLGGRPARFDVFADHASYSAARIAQLARNAAAAHANHLVCTAKDAVKIQVALPPEQGPHWWCLDMTVWFAPFSDTGPRFEDWLEQRIAQA
ncbi:tetraacyldisaccharide 4'-kinase [Desulfonatronum thioautotrophicum]|uniref:tetraacyldisaccharide 4'-kinase n=1 Tax=Desulfonatronum thioautotrophicum TaxID=617001 RepID=UPI001379273F|nr:tetraacyldisaccharide 4'-kinase [Desulfonatronum thioautotrophicum]